MLAFVAASIALAGLASAAPAARAPAITGMFYFALHEH
jgi:hypothetical protein